MTIETLLSQLKEEQSAQQGLPSPKKLAKQHKVPESVLHEIVSRLETIASQSGIVTILTKANDYSWWSISPNIILPSNEGDLHEFMNPPKSKGSNQNPVTVYFRPGTIDSNLTLGSQPTEKPSEEELRQLKNVPTRANRHWRKS